MEHPARNLLAPRCLRDEVVHGRAVAGWSAHRPVRSPRRWSYVRCTCTVQVQYRYSSSVGPGAPASVVATAGFVLSCLSRVSCLSVCHTSQSRNTHDRHLSCGGSRLTWSVSHSPRPQLSRSCEVRRAQTQSSSSWSRECAEWRDMAHGRMEKNGCKRDIPPFTV